MKNHSILFVLCSLLLLTSCKERKSVEKKPPEVTISLQNALDSIFHAHPTATGLMVHVEAPDLHISWSGASGIANKANAIPLSADQPALIASNTKTYTAATLLKLIEKDSIKLGDSIEGLLHDSTSKLLADNKYDLQAITIGHLMSHTSGITDYVNEAYMVAIDQNKQHRWTRNEQINLAMISGGPLGQPGEVFSYADVNFLLLTEIIENQTKKPFYEAIPDLLGFQELGLNDTWFESLQPKPQNTKLLAHQYYSEMEWNSHELDKSFDLYGAGGIAATTKDLASFSQELFNGNIVKNPETLHLIHTKIATEDGIDHHYAMGLQDSKINGYQAFGHGGFWGTVVQYFPELNTSISVYVLERDKRMLRKDILETIVAIVGQEQK